MATIWCIHLINLNNNFKEAAKSFSGRKKKIVQAHH